jgi:hypothetical protein
VRVKQVGHLPLELAHVLFDELHLLERCLHPATVDGVELLAGAPRIAQLFRRAAQAIIGEGGHSPGVSLPLGDCTGRNSDSRRAD